MSDDSATIAALAQRVLDLEHRKPSPMSAADEKQFMRDIGQFIIDQIAPLKARIAELELTGIKFCGSYQRAQVYQRGDVVLHDSAHWVALTKIPPCDQPGKSEHWQLSVKSPRHPSERSRPLP